MRESELFRLASMSKPIVAVTALALAEQNKLALDEPITKWLPTFRPKLADGREPVITVRQLLTHTAGLTYGFEESEQGPYHRAGVSMAWTGPRCPWRRTFAGSPRCRCPTSLGSSGATPWRRMSWARSSPGPEARPCLGWSTGSSPDRWA